MFDDNFDITDVSSSVESPIVPDVDYDQPTATNGMTIGDNTNDSYVISNQE